MTTQHDFVRKQDRSYFNIYTPIERSFDAQPPWPNKRVPLEPQSEVDRQTGSGRQFLRTVGNAGVSPPFIMPQPKMIGMGLQNNFNTQIKAPVDGIRMAGPVLAHRKQIFPRKNEIRPHVGVDPFSHSAPNPAVNNWTRARVPEPFVQKDYSQYQFHSQPVRPVTFEPKRGHTIMGKLSSDDGKSLISTQQYYSNRQFAHVSHNPLVIH